MACLIKYITVKAKSVNISFQTDKIDACEGVEDLQDAWGEAVAF